MTTKLTGHAEIDHQHAILYGILEKLDEVCIEDKQNVDIRCALCPERHIESCRGTFANLFGEIMAFLVGHVTYEEGLMRLLPAIPECQSHIEKHKSAHAEVSERISKLIFGAEENPKVTSIRLRQVISDWMGEHVSKFDEPLVHQLYEISKAEVSFDCELVTMLDTHVFHNRPTGDSYTVNLSKVSSTSAVEEIRTRLESLTPRQREVCMLMMDGIMNKAIAERLNTSINTIKTHRTEIFRKMEANSLLDLVRKVDMLRTDGPLPKAPGVFSDNVIPEPLIKLATSLRVIVVEDNLALQQAMVSGLKALGHEARGVKNSNELDLEIAAAPIDIILLDIGLGSASEDGFAITERLRRNLRCGIIMVTARAELDARIRGLEEGADAYLVKPVDFGELSAVMNSVARRLGIAKQVDESDLEPL